MLPLSDSTLLHDEALIDGVWVSARTNYTINNPATSAHLADLPNMGRDEAISAVDAASRAFPAWAAKTGLERAQILRRWFDLVLQHAADLAHLMTAEQGRPSAEASGEVQYAASFIEWFAEEAKRVNGDVVASTWPDKRTLVLKQAIGVCAAITPWNFPLAMVTRKLAPALAAGCTIVLKPAPQTPLCALALIDLAQRAGIP
ncbi:MAG: aldehyde dehydrogenase family protein, partial [Burkholderiaceae bacterium]|nr:aldehyde dehydrogenase family protein [Burkholderiaceae bacterium]